MSGKIELNDSRYRANYVHVWDINSDCDQIEILSELFQTEACCDVLNIAETNYSGRSVIDTLVDGPKFQAIFSSNEDISSSRFIINWSCYSYNQTGEEGILMVDQYEHKNNDKHDIEWNVHSNCPAVHLVSSYFETKAVFDILTIFGEEFSGSTQIDTVVNSSFIATFKSGCGGNGFKIIWSCYMGGYEKQYGNSESIQQNFFLKFKLKSLYNNAEIMI